MSTNNNNWVCFDCHYSTRKPKSYDSIPKCNVCGQECFCLGYKVEVPKKSDKKAWEDLRHNCRERLINELDAEQRFKVKKKHFIEKEIINLESRELNKEREKQIKHLKGLIRNYS